jgi:1-acyl-sn-glycerol-3-phosphate acyltransferase
MIYRFVRALIHLIIRCLTKLEVHGLENLPATGGYIAAANHLGRLDVAISYHLLNRDDIILLVAEKYQKSVLWRLLVESVDAIWVDRFNADLHAMREALRRLKAGGVLVIAPEGTRSKSGGLQEGRPGAAYLASKARVPIVPVAATGIEDARVLASLRSLRRTPVVVRIGEPFRLPPLRGGDREAQIQANSDEIMCRIAVLLPEGYRGVYADHPCLQDLLAGGEASS